MVLGVSLMLGLLAEIAALGPLLLVPELSLSPKYSLIPSTTTVTLCVKRDVEPDEKDFRLSNLGKFEHQSKNWLQPIKRNKKT